MNRREFLAGTGGVASVLLGTSGAFGTATAQDQSTAVSTPDFGKNWSVENISSSANRFDWKGLFAERVDLKEEAGEYAQEPPSVYSFLAVSATPTEELETDAEETSTSITIGGGPIPGSITVEKPEVYFQRKTCGLDPHPNTASGFFEELYLEQTRNVHLFDDDVSAEDSLRKKYSPFCARTFSYDKSKYVDRGYSVTPEWEAGSNDELENIEFRGLYSVEKWKDSYLLVGGMVPDESVSAGLLGEDIVEDEVALQEDLISKMEETELPSNES